MYQQPPSWQQPPYPPPQPYYQTPMTPNPQPPKRKRRTWLWIILGSLVLLSIIGALSNYSSSQSSTTTTSAPTSIPTTGSVPTSAPTQKPESIGQQINDIVQNAGLSGKNIQSMYNVAGDKYEKIQEDIGDGNLTNGMTVIQIQNDCFMVQQALWTKMASHLSEVEVSITMNVIDQYGKESNGFVADCDLKKNTASKFVWNNLTYDQAWKDYDATFIAPFLTQ
jgi:hypothetical protein